MNEKVDPVIYNLSSTVEENYAPVTQNDFIAVSILQKDPRHEWSSVCATSIIVHRIAQYAEQLCRVRR